MTGKLTSESWALVYKSATISDYSGIPKYYLFCDSIIGQINFQIKVKAVTENW